MKNVVYGISNCFPLCTINFFIVLTFFLLYRNPDMQKKTGTCKFHRIASSTSGNLGGVW